MATRKRVVNLDDYKTRRVGNKLYIEKKLTSKEKKLKQRAKRWSF